MLECKSRMDVRIIEHRNEHLRLALNVIVIVPRELDIDVFQHERKPAGTLDNGKRDFQELSFRTLEVRLVGFRS